MTEKQNIEWKERWRDEYFKWIFGYANAQGGKLFIGVEDDEKVNQYLNDYSQIKSIWKANKD